MAKMDALEMAKSKIKSFSDLIPSAAEDVIKVRLDELHDFKNHPFKVLMDSKMDELVESVKENGVLVPILVRKRKGGGYEIIAGHRRSTAARLAELQEIDAICKDFTDEEATIIMVDSNIQREEILVSERAFAYKMKMEALQKQGKLGKGKKTRDEVAEETGENARTIDKYIHLTRLLDELLDLADAKKLKFVPAYELSFLGVTQQTLVLEAISRTEKYPDAVQAAAIRALPEDSHFLVACVEILQGTVKKQHNYKYANKRFDEIFHQDLSQDEVDSRIDTMFDLWEAYCAGRISLD